MKIRNIIKTKWIRMLDFFQDVFIFGKNFSYFEKVPKDSNSTDIVSTPYCVIRKVFKNIQKTNMRFVDIGCGCGRVVSWVAKKQLFAECTGIEINKKAFAIAIKNTKKMNNVLIKNEDAFNVNLDSFDCCYMWKPMKKDKWIELISLIPNANRNKTLILVNDSEVFDWMSKNTDWKLLIRESFKNIYGTRISHSKSMFSIWKLNK